MSKTPTIKTLLVIDDNAAFREAITLAAQDLDWKIKATDDIHDIETWLEHHDPDVVLLDWNLVGKQRDSYVALLKSRRLCARTLLLSGVWDGEREQAIIAHKLAGYRLKPLDLDRLEEELRLPAASGNPGLPGLEAVSNAIDVAIDIFDGNLHIQWSNDRAKKVPLSQAQFLIIKWLRATMIEKSETAARRLDWDGERQRFLETRMFRAGELDALWVARDWRAEGDHPHDHELFDLERNPTREEWLNGVATLLAQRYAISRFRVYKIAQLPTDNPLEPSPSPGPLVMPLYQSGGGFSGKPMAWRNSGFVAKDNSVIQAALRTDFDPQPEHVSDQSLNIGCRDIRYGKAGTSRVVFPVKHENSVIAIFAFDRRLDHINSLADDERAVVDTARRMVSDEAGPLSNEQWRLMSGLVEDIGRRLATRLHNGETDRRHNWHEEITRAMSETFAEQTGSPEMTYDGLSRVCAVLLGAWGAEGDAGGTKISGRILGTTPWSEGRRPPLDAWYIAVVTDTGHWYPIAGAGGRYQALRRFGEHPLTEPHRRALNYPAWKPVAVQDFAGWLKHTTQVPYPELDPSVDGQIGGWAAVPMKVDGVVDALMVVHSPHAHYFTAFRLRLLKQAAQRLLPLLAAARRETRARSAFTAAVMHEVKNDAHAAHVALKEIKQTRQSPPDPGALERLTHYLDGLTALGQDSLDVFQLGRADRIDDRARQEETLHYRLRDLIDYIVSGWEPLYRWTKLTVAMPDDLYDRQIDVEHGIAFRRVVRVLMHNAFRHGRDWVTVGLEIEEPRSGNDRARLVLTVSNRAFREVAAGLADDLNPALGTISSSPLARGRMGLVAARQLCIEAGASLTPLQFESADDSDLKGTASTRLYWPVNPLSASAVSHGEVL